MPISETLLRQEQDRHTMSPELLTKGTITQIKPEKSSRSPHSSVSDNSIQDSESVRGRRQDRESPDEDRADEGSGDELEESTSKTGNGQHRKRKRSRKGLDKKYHCPHDGCGKSYSRAEHLYRHQLNRSSSRKHSSSLVTKFNIDTPKQIYKCDFPECLRAFVRQDLCARHRERHTARGSHLQRKDNYSQNVDAVQMQTYPGQHHDQPNAQFHHMSGQGNNIPQNNRYPPATLEIPTVSIRSVMPAPLSMSHVPRSDSSTPLGDQYRSPQAYHSPAVATSYAPLSNLNRSNSDSQYYGDSNVGGHDSPNNARNMSTSNFNAVQRHASFGSMNSIRYRTTSTSPRTLRSSGPTTSSPTQFRMGSTPYVPSSNVPAQQSSNQNGGNGAFIPQQHFPPMSTLPPPIYNTMAQASPSGYNHFVNPSSNFDNSKDVDEEMGNTTESPMVDGSGPIFGGEGYAPSPTQLPDDVAAWLFSEGGMNGPVPVMGYQSGSMPIDGQSFMGYNGNHSAITSIFPALPPQHPMAVTSILDASLPAAILSEEKRQELLALIKSRFNETNHAMVSKLKEELLCGDLDEPGHVLCLRSMQTYIGSYWYHFHPQMPILHKPTFSAEKAQNLLLLAVIAIGASCLDKMHGQKTTQAGAELSTFLAWHLRGEVFTDADFMPPAKLWIFQALLLLEIYEKMYSTRVLHERAHIHHATTLTLMRRGRTLRGRSALDSPPSFKDDKSSKSSGGSPGAIADTPDQWWNHWITNEATRRVAFAAFVIDSTHATMFGHSATMVAHEMRLPLPCDESLWSATSGLEVSRIEQDLLSQGIKPISFLDGLKRTLGGEPVRTNSFGRTALMAGLLSVSWHMNQRDMQVRSLGVIGGKDLWRGTMTKAFDMWERDFDFSSTREHKTYSSPGKLDEDNIFESRTVLHHLAHMAMHVDIVQCQIFAKAWRLLGRTITPPDYNGAQRNIREVWAPTASARDATFYALSFLTECLAPDIPWPHRSQSIIGMSSCGEYSARDDFLLNRPWVLYFAALIVWSYGYAQDGPIRSPTVLNSLEQKRQDMRSFLKRANEAVKGPQDLKMFKDRNGCMGLLMILRDEFKQCRWQVCTRYSSFLGTTTNLIQLMHEASNLLNNCIEMLRG